MSHLLRWTVGTVLVMVAGILGYLAAVQASNLPLMPPDDVMIETLEWVIPDGEARPVLSLEGENAFPGNVLL